MAISTRMGLGVVQLAVLQGPSQAWSDGIKLQGLGLMRLCVKIQCHAMSIMSDDLLGTYTVRCIDFQF